MAVFDLSVYYPIPLLTTEGYVALTRTLLAVTPKDSPGHVEAAAKSLAETLAETEAGLVSRIDENLSTGLERAFDTFVDGVWLELRNRLAFYRHYRHDGAAMLNEEDRAALDYDDRLERGRIAEMILERMFGSGTDFLRGQFPQQAINMASRLDWLESKQLGETLETIVGEELASLLQRCQIRYEAMVSERGSRDGKSVADLRDLRNRLRVELYAYAGAVGTMANAKLPEAITVVENALRPILIARTQTRRKAGPGLAEDDGAEGEVEAGQVEDESIDAAVEAEAPSEEG